MEQERSDLQSGNGGDSLSTGKVFVFSCPYLGTLEDSDTSLAYPAPANHCFRVKSPAAVDVSHQEEYCLTDRHPGCHVFQKAVIVAAAPEPEPPLVEPEVEQKRRVGLYALPLILILILLAAIVWWPAPGSDIEDALVFGDQAQEESGEDTNLIGDIAPDPVLETNPVEVAPSDTIKATEPAVSLLESPVQQEETATTSANITENNAGDEGVQPQAVPAAGNTTNPTAQDQATRATETTVRSEEETTERNESPSENPQIETITLTQPEPAKVLDGSEEAENANQEDASTDLGIQAEAEPVDEEASSPNTQDAAVTVASEEEEQATETEEVEQAAEAEEAEQTAKAEEESMAITLTDLPVLSADLPAVAASPVASSVSASRGEQLVFVGPGLNAPVGLSVQSNNSDALLVRRNPDLGGDLVAPIDQREEVALLGRNSNGFWLKIRLTSGEEGWVSAAESQSGLDLGSVPMVNDLAAVESSVEEIIISAPEPIVSPDQIIKSAFVDAGALNLRSGPGVEYEPITIVNKGELVGLLGRRGSGPWVKIRLDDGVEGWVNSALLVRVS
ncbi:MAG: SH3 domain-containing protein [Chloroflexi bacterium]|nr:SH3 domain-containing protein [Chloroflexota bacterium]